MITEEGFKRVMNTKQHKRWCKHCQNIFWTYSKSNKVSCDKCKKEHIRRGAIKRSKTRKSKLQGRR